MKLSAKGFSVVEALLVLFIVAIIGGGGYVVYHHKHMTTPASTASSGTTATQSASAENGTTESINSLTTQEITSENSLDGTYTANDQSNAQSTNTAAANLGGAYNESNFQ